jgi:hypothetical protein
MTISITFSNAKARPASIASSTFSSAALLLIVRVNNNAAAAIVTPTIATIVPISIVVSYVHSKFAPGITTAGNVPTPGDRCVVI